MYVFYYHLQDLEEGKDPRVLEVINLAPPEGLSGPVQADVYETVRPALGEFFLVDHTINHIVLFFYYY